jgi:hypothetical protein
MSSWSLGTSSLACCLRPCVGLFFCVVVRCGVVPAVGASFSAFVFVACTKSSSYLIQYVLDTLLEKKHVHCCSLTHLVLICYCTC